MYAVVEIGSLQYKIAEGATINAARLGEEGKDITFDKVLLYANGTDIRVGQPYVKDVTVTAKVLKHLLDDKVYAYKFKKRKGTRVRKGHRQETAAFSITKIAA